LTIEQHAPIVNESTKAIICMSGLPFEDVEEAVTLLVIFPGRWWLVSTAEQSPRMAARKVWVSLASGFPWRTMFAQVWANLCC